MTLEAFGYASYLKCLPVDDKKRFPKVAKTWKMVFSGILLKHLKEAL